MTHGATLRSGCIAGIVLTETTHAPGTALPRHEHAHPALTLVLDGGFVEDFGARRALECGAMTVLLKPAGAAHTNRYAGRGARSFIVEWTDRPSLYRGVDSLVPQVGSGALLPDVLALHAAFRADAPEAALRAEELALRLDARAAARFRHLPCATRAARPRWLDDVIDALRVGGAPVPSLTALAARADVHPVYLARAFRRWIGLSPGTFAQRARVDDAMRLLLTTDRSLGDVALACGFADQSHFGRWFRREVGRAPGRVRREARVVRSPSGTAARARRFGSF